MIARILTSLLGVFLMAAPGLFDLGTAASDNFQIVGPVITTFAVIAIWEATRSLRLWNVPLGAWLILSPLVLDYESGTSGVIAIATGVAVVGLSFVKGKVEKRYGGGWSSLWADDPPHAREARTSGNAGVSENGSSR